MDEACIIRADMFGKMRQKGDYVMLGHSLDFIDAGDVELDILGAPDGFGVGLGDHAERCLRVAGVGFDLVPDPEPCLGRPDGNHFGTRVTGDHRRTFPL